VESRKEIVETGERSSGPDGGDEPIGLGEDKASRLCYAQAVAQFRVGVLKGWEICSYLVHEFMNLSGGICENKIPSGLTFGILHGQNKIFCELETAIAVVGKENKDQRFFFGE
jgi:hypothetical protein